MRVDLLNKLASTVGTCIQYACVMHCTVNHLGEFVLCSGPSMEPTIYSDDVLLTEHISPTIQRIQRGDIVIAKCPSNPRQQICKRIIAMPGDKVKTGFASSQIVPLGHVWLEGDNSTNSTDSRSYGPVPQGLIRSRAICTVWPLRNVASLSNEDD